MPTPVNIHEAKTNFSRLLARVELGEEIIISNRGLPVAKLVPYQPSTNRLAAIGMDQELYAVPDDFNDPLPTDLLAAFNGE